MGCGSSSSGGNPTEDAGSGGDVSVLPPTDGGGDAATTVEAEAGADGGMETSIGLDATTAPDAGQASDSSVGADAPNEMDVSAGTDGSVSPDSSANPDSTTMADATAADGGTEAGPEAGAPTYATLPLTSPTGTFYDIQATVGTQTFALDVDTGSTSMAVAGSTCSSCTGVTPLYTPGASATDQHQTSSSVYGEGSGWTGEIYQDMFALGQGTPSVSMDFVSITMQTGQFFEENEFQGILGLGPAALALRGTTSYVTKATAAGVVPVLGFELCGTSGTLWLGGYDAAAASSALAYTPLVSNGYYQVNVDDMAIGGTSLGFKAASFNEPVFDTGTTEIELPTTIFDAMVAQINESPGMAALFPSQTLGASNACLRGKGVTAAMVDAQLPALEVSFPSAVAGAPDFTLTAAPSQSYLLEMEAGFFCPGIADGGTGTTAFSILGDTFLRAFVSVIDLQKMRVGFAPDVGCASQAHRPIPLATWKPRSPHHHR